MGLFTVYSASQTIDTIVVILMREKIEMSLNVLVVIEQNSWADRHIADSMAAMGHTVHRFYFGEYVSEYYGRRRQMEQEHKNKMLVRKARTLRDGKGLDLIFCYVYDDFLLEKYAKALRALDIPMVNYNVDMPSQWYRQTKTAKYFDIMLCAQPDHMQALNKYSQKTLYFPMAAKSYGSLAFSSFRPAEAITFLGTNVLYRESLLASLIADAFPVAVYGKNWLIKEDVVQGRNLERTLTDLAHYSLPRIKNEGFKVLLKVFANRILPEDPHRLSGNIPNSMAHGVLDTKDIPSLFRYSKVNLGLSRYAGDDLDCPGKCHMKLRDFEVPMAGGFYLVEKAPGYELAFEEGQEVVTWETLSELKSKLKYYLENDKEREEIARAGHARAQRDHGWEVRFSMLFDELGLKSDIQANSKLCHKVETGFAM